MRQMLRWGLLALAVLLVVTACSSDRTPTTEAGDTTTSGPAKSGRFGDLPSPCGPGSPSGSPDQGVTADAIKIGFGDDHGFPAQPGMLREVGEATKAMIRWCNEQGGINGRRIEGTYYDAKATEVVNVMTEACKHDFFLVGHGFVLDSASEKPRQECGLPAVPAFTANPQASLGALHWETSPVPGDYVSLSPAVQLKRLFPKEIKDAGVMFGNYPPMTFAKDRIITGWSTLGFDFGCSVEYNVQGEPDWRPFVQKLKDCGAKLVYFSGATVPNFENILEAASLIDYRPVWVGEANLLDEQFAKWNSKGLADRVYFRMYYGPLFEADQIPAVQDYLDIVKADGGTIAFNGQSSAGSFLLWATAAKKCGNELTRACVAKNLTATKEWTAGGMHAPSNPGDNLPSPCGALVRVAGQDFERVTPKKPGTYECDPSFNFHITEGPASKVVNIGPDRIARL